MGNTSIAGNERLFNITKRPDGMYDIPIETIRKEYSKLTTRVNNINGKLAVLHIVLKEVDSDERS